MQEAKRRLRRTHSLARAAAVAAAIVLITLPLHPARAGSEQVMDPVTDADGRLGQCDVLPGSPPGAASLPWAQLAYNAGARINRWEFRWDREEPQAGRWSFTSLDAAVQSSQKYGLEVLGILIGTPGWAAAPGQLPGNGLPGGLYRPVDDPRNLWATYVRQTVQHFQGQVRAWEVWNEPDLRFFWMSTPDDYFRLLKVAYLVIRATDPGALVLMAGMVVPDLQFVARVLQDARRDPSASRNLGYFDAVAWHAYGPARDLYTNISRFRALLASKGYTDVPIWVTEDGFPASNPNGEPRQAAYVLQTIAYALAAGASKVLVYRASDSTEPKTWGLISAAGVPRQGYVAFQLAARYFAHAGFVTYAPTGQLERFVFYSDQRRVEVIWTRSVADQAEQIEADQPQATLVDWSGASTQIAASAGEFSLTVPGAHYNAGIDPAGSVVGGPPDLLIEAEGAPVDLPSQLYIPPMEGAGRRLVIFNGGAETWAQVSAAAYPEERALLRLPAHAVQNVDLDLLAGPQYRGMYALSSAAPLIAEGLSGGGPVRGLAPSSAWYLPAAPPAITVGNASSGAAHVNLVVFGARGIVRARVQIVVQPGLRADWGLPPELAGDRLAITLRADRPIVVATADGKPADVEAQPQTTWYAVQPGGARLSVFNPGAREAQLDVRFIGSRILAGEQIHLPPHRLFLLRPQGAQAVLIKASAGVTAGYTGDTVPGGAIASQPVREAAIAVAGATTRAVLFNPSQQAAHVSATVVRGTEATQVTMTVGPRQIGSIPARQPSDRPSGLILSSDVPVVAAPAS